MNETELMDQPAANAPALDAGTQAIFVDYLLHLGDNGLILGQRLGEWCGHGPVLEEDIAMTNIALDLIGQARMLLTRAGEIEGAGRDEDALAYTRDALAFRNLLLVEQPNGDFALTMVRQFLFSAWSYELYRRLTASTDPGLAAIAAKAVKEAAYHRRHSGEWLIRLGDGTAESKRRAQDALDDLWIFTDEMFEAQPGDAALAAAGLIPEPSSLRPDWEAMVERVLAEATLTRPDPGFRREGGRTGRHSEYLGHILSELQFLQRAYPGAQW
ncbi:MAG: phenylacetate-CoA oxygenase subunit PaaC [Alphaproteobacteria bacterium]|nr:phenylacetate-CoA oxygenase subunit PaaC [Alphaproteobacteria bacterium]